MPLSLQRSKLRPRERAGFSPPTLLLLAGPRPESGLLRVERVARTVGAGRVQKAQRGIAVGSLLFAGGGWESG